jgi:hypothetical protein
MDLLCILLYQLEGLRSLPGITGVELLAGVTRRSKKNDSCISGMQQVLDL